MFVACASRPTEHTASPRGVGADGVARWAPWLAALWLASLLLSREPAAQDPGDGGAQLERRIAAIPRSHPRLLWKGTDTARVRQKIENDPALGATLAFVIASADAILEAPRCERQQIGRRLLSVSRTVLKRVLYLSFAHRITGEAAYATRAQQEMLAAAAFSDWNPSHFLDVAEMTTALALGYDWLHDVLPDDARDAIRTAIVELGLRPGMDGGWWVRTTNNWNQVCHAGLALGALAVAEHEPDLARQIVRRAIDSLPRAMGEYAPHGAYPEGPGYWKYGTTYNVLALDALRTVLGTDFGLERSAGFLASADYYLHVTGPTGLFFNYSDGGARSGVAPALHWFAARRRDPALLWRERAALREWLRRTKPSADGSDRLLPLLLVWTPADATEDAPSTRHYRADGRTPIATHRSGWDADATFVAIKGGSPSTNHAHMDAGSFVLDADGVRWAMDLGSQNYHSLESRGIRLWDRGQDSERWSVFRLNHLSHNTLVVDGLPQMVSGDAPLVAHHGEGPRPHTIVDLTSVYAGQLSAARRGAALLPNRSVLIQDELVAAPASTSQVRTIRWGMVTRAEVALNGIEAELTREGKTLTLRVLSPEGAQLRTYDTATPRADHDQPNPGTRMIGFEVEVPVGGDAARIAVHLIPGSVTPRPPVIAPLATWAKAADHAK